MRSLADTIERLTRHRTARGAAPLDAGDDRLTELTGFGSNPGQLKARTFIPAGMSSGSALVVVLHGCTQTAAGYDHGSGWSRLAERHGFALLFPEQQHANNPNLCFNWFERADTRRDAGEAFSIRQMIEKLAVDYRIDRQRIFITGLSAGGAMASAMLATYPEVFAGGAIIAGLPYRTARNVPEAFDRMRGHGGPAGPELEALVRKASKHDGPWPTLSIWHGSADATVHPSNVEAIITQWRPLHGLAPAPTRIETIDGYPRRVWSDAEGRVLLEHYSITGMGHGTPVHRDGIEGADTSGPFMLAAGISSTRRIARFWGLVPAVSADEDAAGSHASVPGPQEPPGQPPGGIGAVIAKALRAAGLMK